MDDSYSDGWFPFCLHQKSPVTVSWRTRVMCLQYTNTIYPQREEGEMGPVLRLWFLGLTDN